MEFFSATEPERKHYLLASGRSVMVHDAGNSGWPMDTMYCGFMEPQSRAFLITTMPLIRDANELTLRMIRWVADEMGCDHLFTAFIGTGVGEDGSLAGMDAPDPINPYLPEHVAASLVVTAQSRYSATGVALTPVFRGNGSPNDVRVDSAWRPDTVDPLVADLLRRPLPDIATAQQQSARSIAAKLLRQAHAYRQST